MILSEVLPIRLNLCILLRFHAAAALHANMFINLIDWMHATKNFPNMNACRLINESRQQVNICMFAVRVQLRNQISIWIYAIVVIRSDLWRAFPIIKCVNYHDELWIVMKMHYTN